MNAKHLTIAATLMAASSTGFASPASPTATLPFSWVPSLDFARYSYPSRQAALASPPFNQRKARKNRRRAFAAGDRNAFRR